MKNIIVLSIFICMIIISLNAQDKSYSKNPQTALDFLTLPMDSRSAGIGDVGIATPTDAYAHQHNPSKYLFGQAKSGLTLSYSPWLRNLVKDMNILALSGYYVIDSLQSASASLRYFSMGDMDFYDDLLQYTGNRSPYQLAFDVAYARKLSQYFGGSIGFRYALADLYPSTSGYKKGWGFATDLSFYFQKDIMLGKIPAKLTAGTSLNNLGTKVSFQKNGSSYFMPMFFRLGAGLTAGLNEDNSLMLVGELLRSLVPTKADKLDDSSISGMFSSISEGGFRSIVWALGAEYSYRNMLFARFGYHHESEECGNRKYLTFGTGIVYKIVHFDFSYLAPTGSRHNSMGNTLRLSTAIDF